MHPNVVAGPDELWVCVACGPSLRIEDVEWLRGRARVAVANNAWELAPWADLLLASDTRWWERYGAEVNRRFRGDRYTCCPVSAERFGAQLVTLGKYSGWDHREDSVVSGGLTGYRLINLVGHRQPRKILLLGYDMQHTGGRTHYFGDHPDGWANCPEPERKMVPFERMAAATPVPIVNVSRATALTCFRRSHLKVQVRGRSAFPAQQKGKS